MLLTIPKHRSVISAVSQQTTLIESTSNNVLTFLSSVPEKELEALIPDEQIIAWKWAIVFAFSAPEIGAWLRATRLVFFKTVKDFTWEEFGLVFLFETFHVVGLCLLAFKILPELDVIQGAMLTNCLCFVPSILCKISRPS